MTKRFNRCGELSWLIGTVLLGLSTALMSKAGFGMSVVVSPAYVLADLFEFISAGTMCYICQGFLVAVTCLMIKRINLSFLFTFFSAVSFGLLVDFFSNICFGFINEPGMAWRILLFCLSLPVNSISIAFLLHSYFPPQAPELFVKEFAAVTGGDIYKLKYIYDICSLVLSVAMSFIFFGELRFIGVGTFACALLNGPIIGFAGRLMDKNADFSPFFPKIGRYFIEEETAQSKNKEP